MLYHYVYSEEYSRVPNKRICTVIISKKNPARVSDYELLFILKFLCTFIYFWTSIHCFALIRDSRLFETLEYSEYHGPITISMHTITLKKNQPYLSITLYDFHSLTYFFYPTIPPCSAFCVFIDEFKLIAKIVFNNVNIKALRPKIDLFSTV